MRILQLCHKPPYPANEGGAIASHNITRGLKEAGCVVDVLAMNTHKQFCTPEQAKQFDSANEYQLIETDTRIKLSAAFFNLFSSESYNISRFHTATFSQAVENKLRRQKYDLVILESLFTTTYIDLIRTLHKGKIILRAHNVEFHIWQNLARAESNVLKKWYLLLLAKRLKNYELNTIRKADLIATISSDDAAFYKTLNTNTSIIHVPFGMDTEYYFSRHEKPASEKLSLFHVGSMNWIPHQQAFQWFFEKVWPGLLHQSNCTIHLAGAFMPEWMKALASERIHITTSAVNGIDFMVGKNVMVVPSFSGSGIRIKVVEGLALGKVILTTANGVVGLNVKHGQHLFVSDDPAEWIEIINRLDDNPDLYNVISKNAIEYCRLNHDLVSTARLLLNQGT